MPDEEPRLTVIGGFTYEDSYRVFVVPHKIEELTLYQLSLIIMRMITELTNFWNNQLKTIEEEVK